MALQSSGAISVEDINQIMGRAASAAFSWDGAEERALAGNTSGSYPMSDFYSKPNNIVTHSGITLLSVNGTGIHTGDTGWKNGVMGTHSSGTKDVTINGNVYELVACFTDSLGKFQVSLSWANGSPPLYQWQLDRVVANRIGTTPNPIYNAENVEAYAISGTTGSWIWPLLQSFQSPETLLITFIE